MGALAEGRLGERAPDELVALAEWLLEELDPAGVLSREQASESSPEQSLTSAHELIELTVRHEWLIRLLQASRLRSLARAAEMMPAARRRSSRPRTSSEPNDHNGENGSAPSDSANCISGQRLTSSRLAPELNCHPLSAATQVQHARGLVEDLPTIMMLFSQARLDESRAVLISRCLHQAAETIPDFAPGSDRWRKTESMIASQAPGLTAGQLESLIDRLLLKLSPDGGTHDHEQARRGRGVKFEAAGNGMGRITALVTADIAQLLHGFLDAAADAVRDHARAEGTPDPRDHDQRLADRFSDLIRAWTNGVPIPLAADPSRPTSLEGVPPGEPEQAGDQLIQAWRKALALHGGNSQKVHLNVTVTDAALLGLDTTPGLLEGHGAIPATLARRLGVTPAQVNLIVLPGACTHPGSHPAETGANESRSATESGAPCPMGLDHTLPQADRYRPGRVLSETLVSLFPTCVFPGCTAAATRCDLDHLKPFHRGGPTCLCNIRPACRGHHRLKTFAGWQARPAGGDDPYPPGSTIWTTPDGQEHATPPPCLPGMPGWTSATAPTPPTERQIRNDLMPAAERTSRRTRQWQADLNWWQKDKERRRQEAIQRIATSPPRLLRPPHAPWGEPQGRVAGLGEPPF